MNFPISNSLSGVRLGEIWAQKWPAQDQVLTEYQRNEFGFTDFILENDFPVLSRFMLSYETEWNQFASWALWMRSSWFFAITVCVVYVLSVHIGQRLMSDKKPFELKLLLFIWNSLLALFSIVGTLRVLPAVFYGIILNGPMYHMCRAGDISYGIGSVGLWSTLFVLSKYAELIDTVFLVLRKKTVPFLHWYHHATVLLLSTGTMMLHGPSGIVMIGMNFFVHSIMYTYYAISAITAPPKWGKLVTVIQILQMFAGLTVFAGIVYGTLFVPNCAVHWGNTLAIGGIYASYLLLFVRFYTKRYVPKKSI